MKNDNAPRSQKAKKTPTKPTRTVIRDAKDSLPLELDSRFRNESTPQETFAKNLREHSIASNVITQRAKKVFEHFTPSRFSSVAREGPNYLRPNDNLTEMQKTIIENGLESIRKSTVKHSIKFVKNDELETDSLTRNLHDVLAEIDSKFSGGQIFVKDSIISACKAQKEAKGRLQKVLDSNNNTTPSSNDSNPLDKPKKKLTAHDPSFLNITADTLVKGNVGLQMETATTPESELQYSVADRSKQEDIKENIETFQLRSGPSDVTSYHDFHNLQIAFQSIWTEMFDGQLGDLGRELYAKYVELKGILKDDEESDTSISTINDLEQLLGKIKDYTQQIVPAVSPVPSSGTRPGDTNNSFTDAATKFGVAFAASSLFIPEPITATIIAGMALLISPSLPRLINWESFIAPLPGGFDFIKLTIEEGFFTEDKIEIVLKHPANSPFWKAIQIPDGQGKIAELLVQPGVKDEDKISLPSEFLKNGQRLVFAKPGTFDVYIKSFSLGKLERIKSGTRVTFDWIVDNLSENDTIPPPPPSIAYPYPFRSPDVSPTPTTPPVPTTSPSPQSNNQVAGMTVDILAKTSRLYQLMHGLEKLLSEKKYAFDVFARDSINFGILVTYRQKWVPVNYQVGDLVSTIPLAPKEIRRYTTKVVTKKTRAVKEMENSLQIRKKDSTDTSRVDAEIVNDASNKTSFTITAEESIGGGEKVPYKIGSTQKSENEQSKLSHQVKKDFRESVLKSAEEYKQEHRMEIDTNESLETETTTFHEIQNPNDELAVTYLFYELQRTYRISEKIHKLTPVILVANEVPAPHQINDAWLLQHDWILKRVILDDSFRPALEYLSKSFVGAEINIRLLQTHVEQQKSLVERQGQQVQLQNQTLSRALLDVKDATETSANKKQEQGIFETVKSIFDPGGFIKGDPTGVDASQTIVDFTKDTLARAEKEKVRLESQLALSVSALQVAIDKFSTAVKEHYDRLTEIDRLRLHIKDNILYYMQAIWDHEPPDEQFFRLYDLDVPIVTADTVGEEVKVFSAEMANFLNLLNTNASYAMVSLGIPKFTLPTKKLSDVADLNNLLGYKGNYMMFPLMENNYLTLHMMQDYLEVGDVITVRDPDEVGNYTLDELQEFATCVYQNDKETFEKHQDQFKKIIIDRLTSSRKENELVIVPTTSLHIECLVGTHPLLEDFKLIHRALDVKKVQAEVRHMELENIRLAARALKGKDEDPTLKRKLSLKATTKTS